MLAWRWDPARRPPRIDIQQRHRRHVLVAYAPSARGGDIGRKHRLRRRRTPPSSTNIRRQTRQKEEITRRGGVPFSARRRPRTGSNSIPMEQAAPSEDPTRLGGYWFTSSRPWPHCTRWSGRSTPGGCGDRSDTPRGSACSLRPAPGRKGLPVPGHGWPLAGSRVRIASGFPPVRPRCHPKRMRCACRSLNPRPRPPGIRNVAATLRRGVETNTPSGRRTLDHHLGSRRRSPPWAITSSQWANRGAHYSHAARARHAVSRPETSPSSAPPHYGMRGRGLTSSLSQRSASTTPLLPQPNDCRDAISHLASPIPTRIRPAGGQDDSHVDRVCRAPPGAIAHVVRVAGRVGRWRSRARHMASAGAGRPSATGSCAKRGCRGETSTDEDETGSSEGRAQGPAGGNRGTARDTTR